MPVPIELSPAFDKETEPEDWVMERERRFFAGQIQTSSLPAKISYGIHTLIFGSQLKRAEASIIKSIQNSILITRRFIFEVAAHTCQLKKGKQPEKMEDLIPNYLPLPLKDPISREPLQLE